MGNHGTFAPQNTPPMKAFLRKEFLKLPVYIYLAGFLLLLVALAIWGIVFIRRAPVEYRASHQFDLRDESFFASAHALCDPIPIEGNKITLLHNGDEIFPAMLKAIGAAKKSVNFEAFLWYSGTVGN